MASRKTTLVPSGKLLSASSEMKMKSDRFDRQMSAIDFLRIKFVRFVETARNVAIYCDRTGKRQYYRRM